VDEEGRSRMRGRLRVVVRIRREELGVKRNPCRESGSR
jgi:hypothetical protein